MDDDHTLRPILLTVVAVILILVGVPASCVWHNSSVISEMVKNRADPLKAACAISSAGSMCDVLAAKAKECEKQ